MWHTPRVGPPGAVVGGLLGGADGGAAGHAVADQVNPDGDEVSGDVVPDPGTGDRAGDRD